MIFRSGDEKTFGRMPVNCLCIPAMATEHRFFNASCEIEDFECGVIRSRDEFRVIGREGHISNSVIVSMNDLDVVEVWLPVLDHAVVVS